MLISGVKFACGTCIKGHRASTCKHTDRPLFEIRKKGRPVSQCLLCRDLRKTKQLHIKCICNKKKKETVPAKHSNSDSTDPRNQKTKVTSSSSSSSSIKQPSPIVIPSNTSVGSCDSDGSCSSKGSSSPSYCWALVSPENQCHIHTPLANMGYVFQKSNLEKHNPSLDPSSKAHSSSPSSPSTLFMPTPSPSTFMPILSPSSILDTTFSSSITSSGALISAPLSRSVSSSSTNHNSTLDHDIMKELDDDLCNLLDNMIYQQQHDDMSSLSPSTPSPMASSSSSTINSTSKKVHPRPTLYGHCRKLAQWHPQSPPPGQLGESVIITMTPLPKWTNEPNRQTPIQQHQTVSTTKIVTCYCGPSCACPGCLVHPTRSIFASQGLDPYAGYPTTQPYSFSSDED